MKTLKPPSVAAIPALAPSDMPPLSSASRMGAPPTAHAQLTRLSLCAGVEEQGGRWGERAGGGRQAQTLPRGQGHTQGLGSGPTLTLVTAVENGPLYTNSGSSASSSAAFSGSELQRRGWAAIEAHAAVAAPGCPATWGDPCWMIRDRDCKAVTLLWIMVSCPVLIGEAKKECAANCRP